MRSEGGARFDRWGRSSWAGGYNTKINHHVCLKIIKLLSSPGIRATHNGLPVVPVKFHSDELYAEPSPEVWSKVKVEKTDRSEFRANLKAKKYAGKERVESTAFDSDEGNDGEEGKA